MIACQGASGAWFIISYGTYFMLVSGLNVSDAFKFSIMTTSIGFIGVNVGMYLMRHVWGRRTILMAGATFAGLCHLSFAVAATAAPNSIYLRNCIIAFISLFKFGYNGGVGAASYPVATELVSTRLRAWTVGSATSLGYFLAWLISFCTPYFINPKNLNWVSLAIFTLILSINLLTFGKGAKYGYIWAASNFICVVFFFFFMPELKGRSLESIDELFVNKVPARKFKGFQTTIGEDAAREVERKMFGEKGEIVAEIQEKERA